MPSTESARDRRFCARDLLSRAGGDPDDPTRVLPSDRSLEAECVDHVLRASDGRPLAVLSVRTDATEPWIADERVLGLFSPRDLERRLHLRSAGRPLATIPPAEH